MMRAKDRAWHRKSTRLSSLGLRRRRGSRVQLELGRRRAPSRAPAPDGRWATCRQSTFDCGHGEAKEACTEGLRDKTEGRQRLEVGIDAPGCHRVDGRNWRGWARSGRWASEIGRTRPATQSGSEGAAEAAGVDGFRLETGRSAASIVCSAEIGAQTEPKQMPFPAAWAEVGNRHVGSFGTEVHSKVSQTEGVKGRESGSSPPRRAENPRQKGLPPPSWARGG